MTLHTEDSPQKESCPDRRDDSYMEGEGEFYCSQYGSARIEPGKFVSWSCNHNLEHGLCPRGIKS
jgi:hypothetical protein